MFEKLHGCLTVTTIGFFLAVASVASGQGGATGPAAGPAGGAGTAPGGNPGVSGPSVGGGGIGGGGISGGSTALGGSGPSGGGVVTGPGATGIPNNYNSGSMPGMGMSPQEAPSGQLNSPRSSLRGRGRGLGLGGGMRVGGNTGLGRGQGAIPPSGDKNPAETLLKDMNGTNNGRRSGHATLRPPPKYRRAPLSSDPLSVTPARVEERAVYFKRRGAYEDSIYRPHGGSYQRQTGRTVGPRYPSATASRSGYRPTATAPVVR